MIRALLLTAECEWCGTPLIGKMYIAEVFGNTASNTEGLNHRWTICWCSSLSGLEPMNLCSQGDHCNTVALFFKNLYIMSWSRYCALNMEIVYESCIISENSLQIAWNKIIIKLLPLRTYDFHMHVEDPNYMTRFFFLILYFLSNQCPSMSRSFLFYCLLSISYSEKYTFCVTDVRKTLVKWWWIQFWRYDFFSFKI